MDNNDNKRDGKRPDPKNTQLIVILVIATIVCLFIMAFFSRFMSSNGMDEKTFSEFLDLVEEDQVEKVVFKEYEIQFTLKQDKESTSTAVRTGSGEQLYYTAYLNYPNLAVILREHGVEMDGEIPDSGSALINILVYYILPVALLWGFFMILMRRGGGGIMGVGRSNAKVYVQKETGVTFEDVAGQDEAKESLVEIVDFLHNPQRYATIGARLPKGALLVGPPGTGKTLLAKAVAGEAHVPFFSLSGSDFVEMFVGVGASRVRDLFKQAQQQAPCIVFIDEIDAIGKSRDTRFGGNDEREQTLNQLLAEMDGFDSSSGVFILAATNRPDVLDKALLRPGRLDRRIIVDRPDLKGRIDVLKVHARDVLMDDSVDLEAIALATSGAVGSDLANMVNEAAINAVKNGRNVVTQKDLFEAVEVVLVGKEKKDRIMNEEERRIVSYHEVGHALISALQKDSEPVQKITIVPRTMGALGYVMNVPEEEKYLNTEDELRAMLVQFLGGRAAEKLVFGTVTTGAANDIERATKVARSMVTQYGMSEEFGLMALESIENAYLDGRAVLNCADNTAAGIDTVVKELLRESYAKALELLSQNMDALHKIAAYLIEKETITGQEFMNLFRQVQKERAGGDAEEKKPEMVEDKQGETAEKAAGEMKNEPELSTGGEAKSEPDQAVAEETAGEPNQTTAEDVAGELDKGAARNESAEAQPASSQEDTEDVRH